MSSQSSYLDQQFDFLVAPYQVGNSNIMPSQTSYLEQQYDHLVAPLQAGNSNTGIMPSQTPQLNQQHDHLVAPLQAGNSNTGIMPSQTPQLNQQHDHLVAPLQGSNSNAGIMPSQTSYLSPQHDYLVAPYQVGNSNTGIMPSQTSYLNQQHDHLVAPHQAGNSSTNMQHYSQLNQQHDHLAAPYQAGDLNAGIMPSQTSCLAQQHENLVAPHQACDTSTKMQKSSQLQAEADRNYSRLQAENDRVLDTTVRQCDICKSWLGGFDLLMHMHFYHNLDWSDICPCEPCCNILLYKVLWEVWDSSQGSELPESVDDGPAPELPEPVNHGPVNGLTQNIPQTAAAQKPHTARTTNQQPIPNGWPTTQSGMPDYFSLSQNTFPQTTSTQQTHTVSPAVNHPVSNGWPISRNVASNYGSLSQNMFLYTPVTQKTQTTDYSSMSRNNFPLTPVTQKTQSARPAVKQQVPHTHVTQKTQTTAPAVKQHFPHASSAEKTQTADYGSLSQNKFPYTPVTQRTHTATAAAKQQVLSGWPTSRTSMPDYVSLSQVMGATGNIQQQSPLTTPSPVQPLRAGNAAKRKRTPPTPTPDGRVDSVSPLQSLPASSNPAKRSRTNKIAPTFVAEGIRFQQGKGPLSEQNLPFELSKIEHGDLRKDNDQHIWVEKTVKRADPWLYDNGEIVKSVATKKNMNWFHFLPHQITKSVPAWQLLSWHRQAASEGVQLKHQDLIDRMPEGISTSAISSRMSSWQRGLGMLISAKTTSSNWPSKQAMDTIARLNYLQAKFNTWWDVQLVPSHGTYMVRQPYMHTGYKALSDFSRTAEEYPSYIIEDPENRQMSENVKLLDDAMLFLSIKAEECGMQGGYGEMLQWFALPAGDQWTRELDLDLMLEFQRWREGCPDTPSVSVLRAALDNAQSEFEAGAIKDADYTFTPWLQNVDHALAPVKKTRGEKYQRMRAEMMAKVVAKKNDKRKIGEVEDVEEGGSASKRQAAWTPLGLQQLPYEQQFVYIG